MSIFDYDVPIIENNALVEHITTVFKSYKICMSLIIICDDLYFFVNHSCICLYSRHINEMVFVIRERTFDNMTYLISNIIRI